MMRIREPLIPVASFFVSDKWWSPAYKKDYRYIEISVKPNLLTYKQVIGPEELVEWRD